VARNAETTCKNMATVCEVSFVPGRVGQAFRFDGNRLGDFSRSTSLDSEPTGHYRVLAPRRRHSAICLPGTGHNGFLLVGRNLTSGHRQDHFAISSKTAANHSTHSDPTAAGVKYPREWASLQARTTGQMLQVYLTANCKRKQPIARRFHPC